MTLKTQPLKILALETSCDETAISVLEVSGTIEDPGFAILSQSVLSQIDTHREYGGVFPALAKREHARNAIPLLQETLERAGLLKTGTTPARAHQRIFDELFSHEEGLSEKVMAFLESCTPPDIDAVAVTFGPGLEPALWVGLNTAKALSIAWNKPLLPINHIEAHIASVLIDPDTNTALGQPPFPALALVISGGHTEFVMVSHWGNYTYLGGTLDDAVGEAYDKVARVLDLPYPGGPHVSRYAHDIRQKGDESPFTFPRPMLHTPDLDLSFSGLKTAVLYATQERGSLTEKEKYQIALEFEEAVAETLTTKTQKALKETGARSLIVSGGVSANAYLRERFKKLSHEHDIPLRIPHITLTGDNATMIAVTAGLQLLRGTTGVHATEEILKIRAHGNARISA